MQVINTNIASLNTQRNLNTSQAAQSSAIQRLSSGLRINSAKDDAAGMAISERMSSQIRGLNQAVRNANDGISLAQTAEAALGQMSTNLQRIRELAVQAANDTNTAADRQALQSEVSQLMAEFDRTATQTQFNGTTLLNGSFSGATFQVGANAGQTITVGIGDSRSTALGNRSVGAPVFSPTNASIGGLTINGTAVTSAATSSRGKVDAINAISGTTGVTATQSGNFRVSGTAASAVGALAAGDVTINGVQIGAVTAGTDAAAQATNVAAAINAASSQTGVTATVGSGTNGAAASALILSNTTGAAISVSLSGAATTANTGLGSGSTAAGENGRITLSTSLSGSITLGGGAEASIGFAAGAQSLTTNLLTGVSVSTQGNASAALNVLDESLAQVNGLRATLGAVQSRFEAMISSQQAVSENLSAARSRIQDADFAQETARLTRAQILQQAGVAMLAQANALPQNVLALLRG
jgi:flagellin